MNVGSGCARIFDVILDIGNDGVLVCDILISIRVGYTCVPKFSLEADG